MKIDELMEEFWYNHIYPLLNRLWAMEIEYLLPDQTEEEFKQEMKADLQDIVDEAVREYKSRKIRLKYRKETRSIWEVDEKGRWVQDTKLTLQD